MLIEENRYLKIIETSKIKGQEDVYLKSMRYINLGYPILLFGPPGCGKTSIARHILDSLDREYFTIEANESMTEYQLIGGFHPLSMSASKEVADEFMYKDGIVARAIMHGKNLLIDELTRAPSSAFSSIFLLLSHGILTLEHREMVLRKPDDWVFIATANFGDVGSFKLSSALKRRFIPIYVSYPKRYVEEALIREYAPGVGEKVASRILDFAEETRRMWKEEGALPQGLSTDGIIKMARYCELLAREGIDDRTAFSDAAFHQGVVIADETDQVSIQLVNELALRLTAGL
ncbi:MAG: ATPase AAA [Candidatus Syntrophoarchaeum caldarius]|uniref:ATPase AAA n=1 Tax=Candidatus Syntropharchaeum caldarium TaxID=1838285 RepID=A0A1F2P850_9EURY|nr:MAG: ATPase AAA [Candidatus Syntrophoarchaeum caldarius]